MNQIIFLLMLIILAIALPLFLRNIEGFSNYILDQSVGNFPDAQTQVLVQDTYPSIGKNQLSDETSNDMWWHYPIFTLGSYKQITNNIRYPNNPDDARCTPANFCYAVYKDKDMGSNIVNPLPPLDPNAGTRVGYFDTDENLMTFRTNMQNILY